MEIVAISVLVFCVVCGLIGLFFNLFGTFMILLGATIYAFLTHFTIITIHTLIVLACLYLASEAAEYILVAAGAKRFGASNASIAGAFIGGIFGGIVGTAFFGVGIFFGTFAGIFFGAFLVELVIRRDFAQSLKSGAGSLLGRAGAIFFKFIFAFFMIAVMAGNFLHR